MFVEKPGRAGPFFCDPGWWSEMELVVWEREGCSVGEGLGWLGAGWDVRNEISEVDPIVRCGELGVGRVN